MRIDDRPGDDVEGDRRRTERAVAVPRMGGATPAFSWPSGGRGRRARRASPCHPSTPRSRVHLRGEVVATLAVAGVPVEARAAGDSSTVSPARASAARARPRRARCGVTEQRARRRRSVGHLGRRLADGDDGRGRAARSAPSPARSSPLLRPPAMSTTRVEAGDRGEGRMGCGGLRVVVPVARRRPRRPSSMRCGGPESARPGDNGRVATPPPARAAEAASAFVTSWGRAAAHLRHGHSGPFGLISIGPTLATRSCSRRLGARERKGEMSSRRSVQPAHHHRVIGKADRHRRRRAVRSRSRALASS